MSRKPLWRMAAQLPVFQADGAGAGAGAGDGGDAAAAAAAAAGGGDGGAGGDTAKWWQSKDFTAEEQQWLQARGLTDDDPLKILPAVVKGHRNAEQRLGKGVDTIIEKPAKDQTISDYLKKNAVVFGIPDKEEGYAVEPPKDWPKEIPWDADFEVQARKIAFENGVPPDMHKAYVGLYATKVQEMAKAADEGLAQAREEMLTNLRKDWGNQTEVRITQAKQGMAWAAEKAGIGQDEMGAITQLLSEKAGDAGVMKLFHAIGNALSEDSLTGAGRGDGLAMTPAEARAELARFQGPEGEYGKAVASGDATKVAALRSRREYLAKIAGQ